MVEHLSAMLATVVCDEIRDQAFASDLGAIGIEGNWCRAFADRATVPGTREDGQDLVLVPLHFAFCVEGERSLVSMLSLDFVKNPFDAVCQLARADEEHLVNEAGGYLSIRS